MTETATDSSRRVDVLKPSNVMLVNGSLFGGGAEQVIATLARHLRAMGHQVTIAVIHRGGELREQLVQEGFDVVTEIASTPGTGSTASRLAGLIADRGVEVAHSHDLRSLIEVGICRVRTRRFSHMHTFHFGNYPHVPWKYLVMEALFARVPDQLVAVGDEQRQSIISALRLSPARIRTIWNGVDYETRPAHIDAEPRGSVLRIGSVSTFGTQKGLPTLLEAARILRDRGLEFRLVLVGEGPMRSELEELVRSLRLADHVEFTGWRPDAAKALLPSFDIFVQSSYWEAMSVVILEAMAARRPIVATTVGENVSVLDDEAAILVPPRDAQRLADGLTEAITDPSRRDRLAEAARVRYATTFTGRAMADRYASAYVACRAGLHTSAAGRKTRHLAQVAKADHQR